MLLISDKHKLILVHIPRCGGSSIEGVFWPEPENRNVATLWCGLQHLPARWIRNIIGQKKFNEYCKFTIVRNPFDKMVSEYFYYRRKPSLQRYLEANGEIPFREFIELTRGKPHTHWMPQVEYVFDINGEMLVDYIGRFENYINEYKQLLEKYGLWDGTTYCLNVNTATLNKHYSEFYDDETRGMVEETYKDDLEKFNYAFDDRNAS